MNATNQLTPGFLLDNPTPTIETRRFNGKVLPLWRGKVEVSQIEGWQENPRILIAKNTYAESTGMPVEEIDQGDIFEIMKNDKDVKLKALRDDIIKNGLREPVILDHEGNLLDGNRRFFAVKYAIESVRGDDARHEELGRIEAYVLQASATEEDKKRILVEENFSPSLKEEWPELVKAKMIKESHDDGFSIDELAKKFQWSKTKIKGSLKILSLIEEFITFAVEEVNEEDRNSGGLGMSETEAEAKASEKYQYFNEATKSFQNHLSNDVDFKVQFFKWIAEDKFKSFQEVRIAWDAWNSPTARNLLMEDNPEAGKNAKVEVDYEKRILKSAQDANLKIAEIIKFLNNLEVNQIQSVSDDSFEGLKDALNLTIGLIEKAQE